MVQRRRTGLHPLQDARSEVKNAWPALLYLQSVECVRQNSAEFSSRHDARGLHALHHLIPAHFSASFPFGARMSRRARKSSIDFEERSDAARVGAQHILSRTRRSVPCMASNPSFRVNQLSVTDLRSLASKPAHHPHVPLARYRPSLQLQTLKTNNRTSALDV